MGSEKGFVGVFQQRSVGISQGFMLYQGLIIQMGLPSLGASWGLRKV